MRALFFLLPYCLFLTLLFSCQKAEVKPSDPNFINESNIIKGVWQMDSIHQDSVLVFEVYGSGAGALASSLYGIATGRSATDWGDAYKAHFLSSNKIFKFNYTSNGLGNDTIIRPQDRDTLNISALNATNLSYYSTLKHKQYWLHKIQ